MAYFRIKYKEDKLSSLLRKNKIRAVIEYKISIMYSRIQVSNTFNTLIIVEKYILHKKERREGIGNESRQK